MQQISTFLMFQNDSAEEAINFYISTFKNSEVLLIEKYDSSDPGKEGLIKRAEFLLMGKKFIAIDSPVKHNFSFTPAVSIFVECDSEKQVNEVWNRLKEGASELMPLGNYGFSQRYGWLNDKFGVSWQISLGSQGRT